ncbi:MAG: hypothetical protein IK098_10920 [Bacteroidales bacterium]|nr:hypothetical protein [Bacteroidales bacterium]
MERYGRADTPEGEPFLVTDISFFNGNPDDADAWEREARAKEYKLEIQYGDGTWETREEPFGEVYPYQLFETYQREDAAGERQDTLRNRHEWMNADLTSRYGHSN